MSSRVTQEAVPSESSSNLVENDMPFAGLSHDHLPHGREEIAAVSPYTQPGGRFGLCIR